MSTEQRLLEILVNAKNEGFSNKIGGICLLLFFNAIDDIEYKDLRNLFLTIAKRWPKHSGVREYPVPSPVDNFASPSAFFRKCFDFIDFFDKNTEYGRLRWELVDFVIEQLR